MVLHVGGYKISKYNLLIIIKKIFKKKINIIKFKDFKIDRSLNSKKFQILTKYKIKSWTILVKELKAFMLKNSYDF